MDSLLQILLWAYLFPMVVCLTGHAVFMAFCGAPRNPEVFPIACIPVVNWFGAVLGLIELVSVPFMLARRLWNA